MQHTIRSSRIAAGQAKRLQAQMKANIDRSEAQRCSSEVAKVKRKVCVMCVVCCVHVRRYVPWEASPCMTTRAWMQLQLSNNRAASLLSKLCEEQKANRLQKRRLADMGAKTTALTKTVYNKNLMNQVALCAWFGTIVLMYIFG